MKLRERIAGIFSNSRRTVVRAFVALGLAVAMVGAGQTTAQASIWQWSDGFEGTPSTIWSFDWGGQFELGTGTARSGKNNALLVNPSDFYSVGATIPLRPAQLHKTQCAASVYVSPFGPAKVNFEIIDPASWTYLALTSVTMTGSGYQRIDVGPWTPGPVEVRMRVSLVNSSTFSAVRVDDAVVQCVY